jgi:hypothetical protein
MKNTRGPVALAQNGARSIALGIPEVVAWVQHMPPKTQQGQLPLDVKNDANRAWDELGTYSALGIETRVTTALNEDSSSFALHPETEHVSRTESTSHRLTLPHNPSFLYDSGRSVEVLVTIDSSSLGVSFREALALTEALAFLARAATETAEAPILFLQAPAAPHNDPSGRYRTDGSGERPRAAQACAARMAMSLDEADATKRVSALRYIQAECESRGYGMQVSDSRHGRVRGEWWTLCSPDPRKREDYLDSLSLEIASRGGPVASFDGHDKVSEVIVLTAIGPARIGSTSAIVDDFMARNVVLIGLSVAALQEVAVITAYVGVGAGVVGAAFASTERDLLAGLGSLASSAALTPQQGSVRHRSQLTMALDYRAVLSGPYPVGGTQQIGVPIWMSWSTTREAMEPAIDAKAFFSKDSIVTGCEIAYCRSRRLDGTGSFRGRAKLILSVNANVRVDAMSDWLSRKCEECESSLVRNHGEAKTLIRVAWRERWLGKQGDLLQ